mgnify:FL=1
MRHEDLDAWKKSINIVTEIYKLTDKFPQSEIYGLINQMRRSAVSIASNIAEGCARFSDNDTLKFISISIGSIAELQTQLVISEKLEYMENANELINKLEEVKRMLLGLTKYLKNKQI